MPRTPRTPKKKKVIGAIALRAWRDEDEDDACEIYISMGKYDEKSGTDSYGVPDDDIGYYVKNEQELETLCKKSREENGEDFYLLEYELVEED